MSDKDYVERDQQHSDEQSGDYTILFIYRSNILSKQHCETHYRLAHNLHPEAVHRQIQAIPKFTGLLCSGQILGEFEMI